MIGASIIDKITAPWTAKQVANLNDMQADPHCHPYTCPGERAFCAGNDQRRTLRATSEGFVCRCGRYRQNWAMVTTKL